MTRLSFECVDVFPEAYAAAPTLNFRLRITESEGVAVHALALRCQIRIEPRRRHYDDEEAELLGTLFGDRSRWGSSMQQVQFANSSTMVTGFSGRTETDLLVGCSYDLDVALGQYLNALRSGEVPFLLMFSGTIFGKGENGFWVEQVPWDLEARHRMPVEVWRQLMDRYFPRQGWLRLHRDTLDELVRYKSTRAIPTFDGVISELLARQGVGS